LRDLPQQKIPRELCSGGDLAIFLRSHVPTERFFLIIWIRKLSKHKKRDISGKFKKTRRKEWRKEKEEIFKYVEVPILVCSPSVRNALGLLPSCDPPSGEPTCMGTSPTT
jgi:hypothetical protein